MDDDRKPGSVAEAAGRGFAAGVVGTAAMTLTQAIDARLTGRDDSTVPAQVGQRLLRIRPSTKTGRARLNWAVHWTHGASMGSLRGLMSTTTGVRGAPATAGHFAALWGGDCALYVALGVAPPPWRWEPAELATDLFHKGVLALVTGVVYDALDR